MTPEEIDSQLARTLDDRRLSRSERQALGEFAASLKSDADRRLILTRAFEIAREALANPDDRPIVEWLEDVVKTIREGGEPASHSTLAEAYFSPGDECPRAIARLADHARRTIDVCVFTITDDRLADTLIAAHRRGVALRIITDDAKAEDLGSDVDRFEQAGIPLRVDRSPFHMHHKFAIFDGSKLLTGSFNWTRGASRDNEENMIVADDPRLVAPFAATFARLWEELA
jgi:phosphatidylserine/phosphatidylglycerophosphate/cardiolipin synthase-like enzyme